MIKFQAADSKFVKIVYRFLDFSPINVQHFEILRKFGTRKLAKFIREKRNFVPNAYFCTGMTLTMAERCRFTPSGANGPGRAPGGPTATPTALTRSTPSAARSGPTSMASATTECGILFKITN